MTLRVCLTCLTAFAVGVPRCPHCGSERHAEEGTAAAIGVRARGRFKEDDDTMPKITRHGGPSDRRALPEEAVETESSAEPAPEAAVEEASPAPKKATARRKRPVKDTSEGVE